MLPQTINSQIIHKIFHQFDKNLNIIKIRKAQKGYNSLVYFVNCENSKGFVIKFGFDDSQLRNFEKEILFAKILKNSEIPFPKILLLEKSKEIVPHYYMIMEKLIGDSMSNVLEKLGNNEKIKLYKDFAEIVGKLNSFTFEKFGEISLKRNTIIAGRISIFDDVGPFDSWKDMFLKIVFHDTEKFKNSVLEKYIDKIRKYFEKNIDLLNYKITPRLLHMDLHPGNIYVFEGKISGIIDFDGSLIGHNEYELMRIEKGHFDEENKIFYNDFIKIYSDIIPLDEGYEERRGFYSLSRELVQSNCLIEYGKKYSDNLERDFEELGHVFESL